MTEDQKRRLNELGKFLGIKLPIFLAVIFILMILTLKLVERYPDPLREGFQEYLSNTYGTNATIGKLEEIQFFPIVNVHATNVTMHNKSNAALVEMSVESFKVSAPFWSLFLNTGRLYGLEIRGLLANEGFILPKEIRAEAVEIFNRDGHNQYGAFLIASGTYDNQKMAFEAELDKKENGYSIPKKIPYALGLGKTEVTGQVFRKGQNVQTLNTVLSVGGQNSEVHDYDVSKRGSFSTDNPLYCVLNADNLKNCEEYLEK